MLARYANLPFYGNMLAKAGFKPEFAEVTMKPSTEVEMTGEMIHDVETYIVEISKYCTLVPGDVIWMGTDGAPRNMKPGDVDWKKVFSKGVRWFHTGGIFAALDAGTSEAVIEAVEVARKYGTVVSYDLNYRASLWKSQGGKDAAQRVNREIAKYVDVMIGNEEDFTACLGFEVPGMDEHISEIDPANFKKAITIEEKLFKGKKFFATLKHGNKGVRDGREQKVRALINSEFIRAFGEVDLLEGQHRTVNLPVTARVEDYFGIKGLMDADALSQCNTQCLLRIINPLKHLAIRWRSNCASGRNESLTPTRRS